jgi:hypothetical protein
MSFRIFIFRYYVMSPFWEEHAKLLEFAGNCVSIGNLGSLLQVLDESAYTRAVLVLQVTQ